MAEQQSAVVRLEMKFSVRMSDLQVEIKQRFLPFLIAIVRHGLVNILTILFGFLTVIQLFLKKGLLVAPVFDI